MYFIPICVHTKTVPYKKPRISNKHRASHRVFSLALAFSIKNFCSSSRTEHTLRFTTIVNKHIFYIYSYNHRLDSIHDLVPESTQDAAANSGKKTHNGRKYK